MEQVTITLVVALTALLATALVSATILRGWRDWLAVKRHELDRREHASVEPSATSRIEVADLKERIRKLEAIAAGDEY